MARSSLSFSSSSSALLLIALCYGLIVVRSAAASSAASSSDANSIVSRKRNNSSSRPTFLQHVTTEQLQDALRVAGSLHQAAVAQALSHYPVDDDHRTNDDAATIIDQAMIDAVTLKAYPLQCEGSLPDFANVLPTTVYVTDPPLLSPAECASVIQAAEEHFATTTTFAGAWTRQRSGQYEVSGFYLHQIPAVREWFLRAVKTTLFPVLAKAFPDFCESPNDLCVDNAYLFKYTPETGRRTDVHTDSGCLSFTIALNPKSDYEGGGTWFQGLVPSSSSSSSSTDANKHGVVEMDVGQVAFRPGGVKHCGYAVTSGTRYIIGGFCMHRRKAEHVRMLLSSASTAATTTTTTDQQQQQHHLLEAATVLNPASDAAYNLLAHSYEQRGDKAKAQQVLEYCLENVHTTSGEVAYSLGSLYMEQRLFQKAADCMQICLDADAFDVDAMMGMATAASALGDSATEEFYYQQVISNHAAPPGSNNIYNSGPHTAVVASAYCNLGVLHEGEEIEVDYYRKCLALLPNNFAARYSLACALASRQEWPEAVASFQQAIAVLLDSNNTTSSDKDGTENLKKALQSLYTATAHMLQSQPQPPTREEMMQRFQDAMGADNFNRLVSLQGQ